MTIEQTIDIPADHRLHLDMLLPESIPGGKAKIKLFIKPFSKRTKVRKPKQSLTEDDDSIPEGAVPLGDGTYFIEAPPGYTPPPPSPELAAIVKEAEERAERERTDPVYRAEIMAHLRKSQEGGPIFGGMDGMEFQRKAREGWLD
ncbi:hypothetical protein AGMMS49942_03050 [Spirochaetia bacterium]|nr:hypothetical protein AGMMS49942_03050 [Spirochaetia bacterium]